MKKRVLSLFMVLVLCLTLLPTAAFAEGEDVSISGGVIGGGETGGEGGGIYVAPGSPTEGGGGTYIPGEDTRTEIWCTMKPSLIQRNYDGTTDGGKISIDLGFTDGTNTFELTEGTGFTAKKTFDSADAGRHTVTVEIELIGDAAAKYRLKAGEETFTIGGYIDKAYPDLTVTLSKTACTAGEKLLPLLSVEGAPEDAEVTYYYLASAFKSWAGSSDVEGSEAMPKIDENTAISEPGTYYVYAKTGETKNYEEERSTTVELTVNEAVVEAASITKADGTDGGTYESLPAALNAAQDGDTVKLLADHVTDADALNALGEDFTFEQYASIVPVVTKTLTLDLNHKTVDYLEVGFSETNEETQKKETLATGNLTVTGEGAYGRISNLMFMAGALDIRSGEIGGSEGAGLVCDVNSGTATISNGTVYGLTVMEGASVTVNGGSKHAGEWVVASGATLNITDGTFGEVQFTRNGTIAISGGTFKSIKSYIAEELQPLMSLLDTQKVHAFYKGDDVQNGNATELADVTVKEHTHTMVNNKCACGFSCTHTNTEGASTIGEDGKCTVCGTQFAAGIGETYYTDVPSALDAATDGQTVKLLANAMLPDGIYASKTLTLDLNGHSLSGYSLNVGGLTATSQVRTGKLTVIDSSGGNGAVGVTVRDGGTLVFDPKNDHTTLLQLEVWGGTVELYGGKISRSGLRLNNGITLGDLLPQKAGLAYYRGDTQLTLEEASSQTCDLVVKSCSHGGKNGFDNNSTACPYCNAPAVAETALYNGEGNRLQRKFADLQTALDADRDGGATLKLLADVTGDYTIDGTQDTGLDLNDHSIKGTVTVKAAAGSNTTTLSNTKNTTTVSIDNVVAYKGAKLAGSGKPAVIGTLTLAEGATWKTILNDTALGYKVLNADGTHKWYARDDVKGSQLNNVIINRLPITTKTLYLKVNGKNLTGNSPKVERGTTVQLCASCNAKDVTVTFSILKTGETTPITLTEPSYSGGKYTKDYSFDTIGEYTIYFTATKDGYTVQSAEKKLTVTKPNLSNAEITFRSSNESTYEPYRSTTTAPGFTVTYNGKTLKLGVDYTASGTASSAGVSTQTLTIKAVEGSDYTGSKTAEWRIVPHKAKVKVGDVIKAYDGTTDLPDGKISLVSAAGSAGYQAGLPLPLSEGNGFELTDAKYDSANASETEKNISFTVKLTDTNYTFEDGTTEKAFTLNGADFDDKTFQINKATIASDTQLHQTVFNDLAKTYKIDLKQFLDKILPEGGTYGDIKYGRPSVLMDSAYYPVGGANIENGKLSLSINKAASVKQGDEIGTVAVEVETTNYQPFTLTIHVNAQDKLVPVLAEGNTVSASEITYGQTLADSKLTVNGTMKDPNTSATVDGTFTWTDGTIKPDAGSYDAEWIFTPAEGYEEYATATGKATVKVAPKSIEGATITLKKREFTYNAAEQSPTITGVTLKGWSETITTYDIVSGDKAINANDSITLTIKGTGNYTGTATAEWKIIPAKLTVSVPSEVKKEYDGTTNATVTPTFNGLRGKDNLTAADYSVTAAFDNAKVGYKKTVIGKVTLNQTETAKNYVLTNDGNFSTGDGTITKAVAPTVQPVELTIYNGVQADYYVDLPSLPDMGKGKSYGTVGYRKTHTINLSEGYKAQSDLRADPENLNTLRLLLHMTQTGSLTGEIGTVTIPVTTSNYQDITLTVNVSAKNRITPTGTPTLSKNAIIYGDALNTIALSGKLHDNVNNVDVDGTFEWVDGTHIPAVGNGTYAAEWIFEPTDTEKYLTVSGRSNITVEKARQYGKLSMAGYTYGKTPSTPTLTDQTGDLNAQVTYSYAAADSGSVQTWDISNPPALNAGTYRMYASIGDTDNYYGFEAVHCEFVVAKATPTYTAPTGLTAKYGQTLADVTLPDGWSWMDSSESVGGASTAAKTFQAKFTPKDTENYNTVENIELEVTVNKADGGNLKTVELEQKYTDASDHTYTPDWARLPAGQDWTFSSEASIVLPKQDFAADGNLLTYAISGGKAGDKITLILKASCDNYEDFTITLNVTLTEKDDQKPLTITGNTSVIYGEKLTLTTTGGSGMGAVTYRIDNAISTGEATIDPETGVLTPVKVGSVSVIATKAGDNDYNDVTSA
ncbi:YDG domain-containing protein, partial [Hominenteromicrobium sp.]|uniref:YDG domain-containing protein n=1 Tax=Hominenteromicrobium sp. TaxID=3073581 RepID=UPI003AB1617C